MTAVGQQKNRNAAEFSAAFLRYEGYVRQW